MSVTIPRTEIDAVMARHDETCFADLSEGALTGQWVRALADAYRGSAQPSPVADDLDALADRYEKEKA